MTVVYIKLDSLCLLARTYPEEAIDSTPSTSGGSITAIDIEDCSSRSFKPMNGSYSSLPLFSLRATDLCPGLVRIRLRVEAALAEAMQMAAMTAKVFMLR